VILDGSLAAGARTIAGLLSEVSLLPVPPQ
jgi:hypothetical protein